MPLVIRPTSVVKEHHFTTETNRGEVTVNINLTVTLTVDQTGAVTVSTQPMVQTTPKKDLPDYVIQIPELESVDELIDFGKDVNS